jgi:hypothetical protein
MMTDQERYEHAYQQRAELRRGDWREAGREPQQVNQPQPHECPRCRERVHFCATNDVYSRFVCRLCWHAWGSK